MNEWDIILWAILGLLLINHIRLNFLLMRVTKFYIAMEQNPSQINLYIPEESLTNSDEIKEWDESK